MKLLLAVNAGLFVLSAALFIALFAPAPSPQLAAQGLLDGAAQEDESEIEEEAEQENNNGDNEEARESEETEEAVDDEEEANVLYEYVAQPGDSYTKMARKAAQTYGLKFDVSLTSAQIIFVETNLTQVAGSPLLELGEEVAIDEAVVGEWVEAAGELSDSEEAAWAAYAPSVDFNTDNVGE